MSDPDESGADDAPSASSGSNARPGVVRHSRLSRAVRALAMVVGPILVLGTMAAGLRLGAESPGLAAMVIPMPTRAARDRLVWQLRAFREERRIREPAPNIPIDVVVSAGDAHATWSGITNLDGIAEATLPLAKAEPGTRVTMTARSGAVILADGIVTIPEPGRTTAVSPLKATERTGPLDVKVYGPPGGVAAPFEQDLLVTVDGPDGHRYRSDQLRMSAEPDPGLEVIHAHTPHTTDDGALLRVRPLAHVLGLRVEVTGPNDLRGTWYGSLEVVHGGDEITLQGEHPERDRERKQENELSPFIATAPITVAIRTPTPKPVVYVEILDGVGREVATSLPVEQSHGFGVATLTVPPNPALGVGPHWAVVSSLPDGFREGSAVAKPFCVESNGEGPPGRILASSGPACDAHRSPASLAPPPFFPRAVVLDGFVLRRAEAARTRAKGVRLAVGALIAGGLLAALMLFTSLRASSPHLELGSDVERADADAITKTTTARWVVVAILLTLSCLAYLLLAALVLYSGS